MKFLNAEYFFLIWVVPALAVAYLYGWRRRARLLNHIAARKAQINILPKGTKGRRRIKAMLVLVAVGLLVVAMAGPQYGFQWQRVERRGIDLILALDCSRSMLARDIQPTRLDRAKREIKDLLDMVQGDRVGLVAFSGTAFLQCPLTMDYSAFYLFLDVLTPDYLPMGGTDLGAALHTAQEAFDPKGKADRAIILITDGENTGPDDPMDMVQAAQKAGIKLFCIGVGSADGVPIPAAEGGFKKDTKGQIVMSRLDHEQLSRMALATGGTYVQSVAGDMDLEAIYRDQIQANLVDATVENSRKQVWSDRFQWPLALAVILLLVVLCVPTTNRTLVTVTMLSMLWLGAATHVQAGPLAHGYENYSQGNFDQALEYFIQSQLQAPNDPAVLYNLGNTYYKKGDFGAASDHYSQALAMADDGLKPKLHYNLGNSAYRQGQLKEAIQHYEKTLALFPEDQQAKDNLEFVKKKLEQQQKEQQEEQQQENENDQQSDSKTNPQQEQQTGEDNPQQAQSGSDQNLGDSTSSPQAQQSPQETSQKPDHEEQAQQQQAAKPEQDKREPSEKSAAAKKLNRLKDQPGKAMMPAYEQQSVEKDW